MIQRIKIPLYTGEGDAPLIAECAPDMAYTEVEGEIIDDVFAIHPTLYKGEQEDDDPLMTLTHIPTGGAISHHLSSVDAGRWLVDQIKGVTDWKTFTPSSDKFDVVLDALKPLRRRAIGMD